MRVFSLYQFVTQPIATMVLVLVHLTASSSLQNQKQCPTFYLLNVEPYPTISDYSGAVWDKAFELIPAGHLAAEQINNRSDILPGHELKLIDIESEACGMNIITKGIINMYKELVNPNQTCIVGVIGLYCFAMTSAISPIISHQNIGGYVPIAASTSPVHHGSDYEFEKSSLFHIIGSSSVFNEATLALMRTYDWKRITSVHTDLVFYFRSIAHDFINRVSDSADFGYELISHLHISINSPVSYIEIFSTINSIGARISYWSVTDHQAANLLCRAFQKNFTWPGYVYIIEELSVDQILQVETSCNREEVLRAMEGALILEYRLYVENDTELVSGINYSEFQRLYTEKLEEFASDTNHTLKNNVYANSLYDQVWAFALAINNSISSVESQNLSFEDYGIGKQAPTLANVLKSELKDVSFQGASGRIDFSENQESPTFVNIFQIQEGNPQLIGVYDPHSHNVTLTEAAPSISNVPLDTFKTVYQLLPPWLGACILMTQVLLFCLITTNMILIIRWKTEREVKAISPLLSLLMMIGCYFLCVAPLFMTKHRTFVIDSMALVTSLCYLKIWASIGIELILSTLFLRLLRIYRIFREKQMTIMSNFWVDKYLLLCILLICIGKVFIFILWNSITPISSVKNIEYIPGGGIGLPYYQVTTHCVTSAMWSAVTLLYSGVLLFMVIVLAIETRHIKNNPYKDTKKVNVFIFFVAFILPITISLWIIFEEMNIEIGANIFEWLSYFSVPLLCQVCLFVPKTLPLIIKFASRQPCMCSGITGL